MANVTYEKVFDGNETSREGRNGRIYAGVVGWVYVVRIDGDLADADGYKTVRGLKVDFPTAKRRDEIQSRPVYCGRGY